MQIDVNGMRLWFDVDGPAVVPDGSEMRQRPTVVLVHGGPGSFDHSYFKPDFARLAEHAQVVYLDLRGHGRSDWGEAAAWSFEACADDVRVFCDTIGIARSILGVRRVLVSTSAGRTDDSAGSSSTSSKVRPSLANFGG